MTQSPVGYTVVDGIATISLNRPESMNSLDVATKVALRDAVTEAAGDAAVRCVVLTGSGRAFCVGQDLKEHVELLKDGSDAAVHDRARPLQPDRHRDRRRCRSRWSRRVNGVAAGAGASLAFACDFRLLADTAGFNLAFSGIALSCDTGSRGRCHGWSAGPRRSSCSTSRARSRPRRLSSSGSPPRSCPTDELVDEVATLARRLADGPTVSFGAIRRSVEFSATHDFATSLGFEAEMMALTGATEDHRNAVDAFVAKEKPVFKGR